MFIRLFDLIYTCIVHISISIFWALLLSMFTRLQTANNNNHITQTMRVILPSPTVTAKLLDFSLTTSIQIRYYYYYLFNIQTLQQASLFDCKLQ